MLVKRIMTLLLLAVSAAAQARTAPHKPVIAVPSVEFRGFHTGMTFDEASKLTKDLFQERMQDCSLPAGCIEGFIRPEFWQGKMISFRLKVTAVFYGDVKRSLLSKYYAVKPKVEVETYTNAYGRVTTAAVHTWHIGNQSLVLREIDTAMTEVGEKPASIGSVTITDHTQWMDYYSAHKHASPPI